MGGLIQAYLRLSNHIPGMLVYSHILMAIATALTFFSCEGEPAGRCVFVPRVADSLSFGPARDSIMAQWSLCLVPAQADYWEVIARDTFWLMQSRERNGGFETGEMYFYLKMHYDSIGPKQILEKDVGYPGVIKWQQEFSRGIRFVQTDRPESGNSSELYTKCKDKTAFLDVIAPIIEIEYNPEWPDYRHTWKRDSTRYEPIERSAGCRYEIRQDAESCFFMLWYCGC